jgi:hypothetical protein
MREAESGAHVREHRCRFHHRDVDRVRTLRTAKNQDSDSLSAFVPAFDPRYSEFGANGLPLTNARSPK